MTHFSMCVTVIAFVLTVILVMWRPRGLNESIPATVGALLVIVSGEVSSHDLVQIVQTLGGAVTTIMATIVMAFVLESFGFFHYIAEYIADSIRLSGRRLFWYINLLCFLMTLFFNNDGSILITTPILLILLRKLGLRPHQQIPYLLSGALIATASSVPIGVSNVVNLISLKIIGMNLDLFTLMMFVPAMLGLLLLVLLLYFVFRKELPHNLNEHRVHHPPLFEPRLPGAFRDETDRHNALFHPLDPSDRNPMSPGSKGNKLYNKPSVLDQMTDKQKVRFTRNVFLYVLIVRISLFVAAYFGIPEGLAAVLGAVILLAWRWAKLKKAPTDILRKTPWTNIIFVCGMYIVIYGLYKLGLPTYIVHMIRPLTDGGITHVSLTMGFLVSAMSNLFNNHPALMISTLTLQQMGLTPFMLKVAYLSSVVGSDLGSLVLPIGTLATLMWMHILKQHHIRLTWRRYIRVTAIVIPVTVLFTLLLLCLWVSWIF